MEGFTLHKSESKSQFHSLISRLENTDIAQKILNNWRDVVFITLDSSSPKITLRYEFLAEVEKYGKSLISYALVKDSKILWIRSRIEGLGFARLIINSLDSDISPGDITEDSSSFWFHFLIDRLFDELFFDRLVAQLTHFPNLKPLSSIFSGQSIKAKPVIEVFFHLIYHHTLNGFRDICLRWKGEDLTVLVDQSTQKHVLFNDISNFRFMSSFYEDEKASISEEATENTWLIHFHSSEKTTRRIHKTCFDSLTYE